MNALAHVRGWSPTLWGAVLAASLVLGAVIGNKLDETIDTLHGWLRPVSTARVGEVQRAGDEIRVRVYVTRHRAECRLTGVYAYAEMAGGGPPGKANAARVDGALPGDVPTIGQEIDVGWWRVWPVLGAKRLVVWAYYDCDGHPEGSRLFEVQA